MGLLAALLSACFSASKDLLSKRLAASADGMASTFASFAFALPYYLVVLAVLVTLDRDTVQVTRAFLVLVWLRSVTDSIAEGMKMYAFAHGDISMVAMFFSISPLFLLITSPLITGDELSLPGVVATILVVGGSLLMVYRPSEGWRRQKQGILLAAGASLFFSLNTCFDRLAVQEGSPAFAGFAMTLLSALLLLPFVIFRRDRLRSLRSDGTGFLARGFLEVAFMVAKLTALQYLQAPYVVSMQRLSLVLSIIGGRVFFHEADIGRRLVAGIIIAAGVAVIVLMPW